MRARLQLASLVIGLVAVMVAGCVCAGESTRRAVPEIEAATSLDFGQVAVGRTAELRLVIANTGLGPLDVTDAIVEGTQADAFDGASPTLRLQPGSSGELSLVFRPGEAGEAVATLVLTSNDPERPRVEVELRGEGLEPEFEVSPRTLDFGKVVLDTGRALEVEVTNLMSEPLVVDVGGVVPESDAPHFDVALPDGPGRLEMPAEGSARLQVVYRPAGIGAHSGSFTLEACPSCAAITVDLEGEGIATGLQVEPDALDFGYAHPDRPLTKEVTFRNVGNVPVAVTEVGLAGPSGTGSADAVFTLATPALPLELTPGSEVHVPVHFTPPDLTSHIASLVWRAPETPVPHGVVLLLGAGGGPAVEVSPLEVDFGLTAVAVPRTRKIAISNTGYTDLAILGHERTGSASFEVTGPETVVLAPEQTTELTVRYLPEAAEEDTARLRLLTDDPYHPDLEIPLSGQAVELPPCEYETKPQTLDFGIVMRSQQVVLAFDVTNLSVDGDCLVGPFRLMEGTPADFSLVDAEEGRLPALRLGPGEQMRVRVAFRPSTWSQFSGGVGFEVSDPGTPADMVTLAGESTSSAVVVTPSTLEFGEVEVPCGFARRSFCVSNTGATDARVTAVAMAESVDADHFVLVSMSPTLADDAGLDLEAGAEQCFSVHYLPTDVGEHLGAVRVSFEAPGQTQAGALTVGLMGEGGSDGENALDAGTGCFHGRVGPRLISCAQAGVPTHLYGVEVTATIYSSDGAVVLSLQVEIDADGYFALPGVPEGVYRLVLEYEDFTLELPISAAEGVVAIDVERGSPYSNRVAHTVGVPQDDDIAAILNRIGVGEQDFDYRFFNGLVSDIDLMRQYGAIFMPCGAGMSNRIIDNHEAIANILEYVQGGGNLYLGHGSFINVLRAWPGILTSGDLMQNATWDGFWVEASVRGRTLRVVLDLEVLDVQFAEQPVAMSGHHNHSLPKPQVLLSADLYGVPDVPIMLCFNYGDGYVFYTTFHHDLQSADEIDAIVSHVLHDVFLRE